MRFPVLSPFKAIKRLVAIYPRVLGIQFSRNFGQHYGITTNHSIA
jgi:hypothetical protein